MIWPIYAVYVCCVGLIRVLKWLEYQVLKLFIKCLKRGVNRTAAKIGVVIHYTGEERKDEDSSLVLAECTQYDKLVHLKVHDERMFARWANLGSLAIGETYVDKLWDYAESPEDLTQLAVRGQEQKLLQRYYVGWNRFFEWLELYAFNLQTRERAFQVGVVHYDLGECEYQVLMFGNEFLKKFKFSEFLANEGQVQPAYIVSHYLTTNAGLTRS